MVNTPAQGIFIPEGLWEAAVYGVCRFYNHSQGSLRSRSLALQLEVSGSNPGLSILFFSSALFTDRGIDQEKGAWYPFLSFPGAKMLKNPEFRLSMSSSMYENVHNMNVKLSLVCVESSGGVVVNTPAKCTRRCLES